MTLVGREKHLQYLSSLIGLSVLPSFIYVHGGPSTGKSTVVERAITATGKCHAIVHCVECFTPRLMFERILNQLANFSPVPGTGYRNYARCENLNELIFHLNVIDDGNNLPMIIVVDHAHILRDQPSILNGLQRLNEISSLNICVVFLSWVPWDRMRLKSGVAEPIMVPFGEYEKNDVIGILLAHIQPENATLFKVFADLLYNVFHYACVDVVELKNLAILLFPQYKLPVDRDEVSASNTSKLYTLIQPFFKEALDKLFLREISSSEWKKVNEQNENNEKDDEEKIKSIRTFVKTSKIHDLELPVYSKFLLISSYLASYNPSRADNRLFVNTTELRKKKGGVRRGKMLKVKSHMRGPKGFAVERMLGIFYNLIDESVPPYVDISHQVSTLVSLRLLLKVSNGEKLDGLKLKANVSFDFILKIAKSVEFDITKYLIDFA